MRQERNIQIPLSIFERPVEKNTFALLRFFVELVGKQHARAILTELAGAPTSESITHTHNLLLQSLKEIFPSLAQLSDEEIEERLSQLYNQADIFVKEILATYYEGMALELDLLDNTTTAPTNLAHRILELYSPDSTPRVRYEILRQDLLALVFLELQEKSPSLQNRNVLQTFQSLFEEQLYSGVRGEVHPRDIYSVHTNQTNNCVATFASLETAKKYVEKNGTQELHIKRLKSQMRKVENIGYILSNIRIKSGFSAIRKILYKSQLEDRDRKRISIGIGDKLQDMSGFMFIVPNGKRKKMLDLLVETIKQNYPRAQIVYDSTVDSDRGQSRKVAFLRAHVSTQKSAKSIEIMIFNQVDYMNYLFELEQAHPLFNFKKTEAAANLLFPQSVYPIDPKEIALQQEQQIQKMRGDLRTSKMVSC